MTTLIINSEVGQPLKFSVDDIGTFDIISLYPYMEKYRDNESTFDVIKYKQLSWKEILSNKEARELHKAITNGIRV